MHFATQRFDFSKDAVQACFVIVASASRTLSVATCGTRSRSSVRGAIVAGSTRRGSHAAFVLGTWLETTTAGRTSSRLMHARSESTRTAERTETAVLHSVKAVVRTRVHAMLSAAHLRAAMTLHLAAETTATVHGRAMSAAMRLHHVPSTAAVAHRTMCATRVLPVTGIAATTAVAHRTAMSLTMPGLHPMTLLAVALLAMHLMAMTATLAGLTMMGAAVPATAVATLGVARFSAVTGHLMTAHVRARMPCHVPTTVSSMVAGVAEPMSATAAAMFGHHRTTAHRVMCHVATSA